MHKLALIFPGQGSHFVGMCKKLYSENSIVRETFKEAEEVLNMDIKKLCFEGPLSTLTKAENAQVAILTSSVAIFRVYMKETGYIPEFLAGHSLGEYSALTCAGVFSFKDSLKLVKFRAQLAERAVSEQDGGMTIIDNIDPCLVEEECLKAQKEGRKVYISCYNSEKQVAISGVNDDVMYIEDKVSKLGAQVTPLFGSAPYHSPLMESYSLELAKYLENVDMGEFRYPVISNYTGKVYSSRDEVITNLKNHFTHPVKWTHTINFFSEKNISMIVEMGFKNILLGMILKDNIDCKCFGVRRDREELDKLFNKNILYSKHKPTFISKCLVAAVSTKNQNWDKEEYNEGVIKSYKKLEEIQENQEYNEENTELLKEALKYLRTIFNTKKVEQEEQDYWIRRIMDESGKTYLL